MNFVGELLRCSVARNYARRAGLVLVLVMVAFGPVNLVLAEEEGIMNRLFAPGPLTRGHDQLEGMRDCKKCHESGKGVSESKCLECHKEIKKYLDDKAGFHGKQTAACISCHHDHKGRDFDSALIDTKTFDHGKTGYVLAGKHAQIKCLECHKEKRGDKRNRPSEARYVGAASNCRSCHEKDDVHFYKGDYAKKDCGACHGLSKWDQEIKFDHKRDTQYDLVGAHGKLECADCHNPDENNPKQSVYKWPHLAKDQCLSCHENFHHGNLGAKFRGGRCTTCHTQTEWPIKKFDHEITGYALRGVHAEADCLECHTSNVGQRLSFAAKQEKTKPHFLELKNKDITWTSLGTQCLSCHQDYHRFGNYKSATKLRPNDCLSCHGETDWKKLHDFNHNVSTRYAIDGEHRKLKCSECHLSVDKKPILPPKPGIYLWPHLTDKTCENCHKSPHIGKFSQELLRKECSECHVTDGWQVVKTGKNFDHATTRFPLTGKHVKATCTQCHVKNKEQVFRWNSPDKGFCIECHQNVHKEQFHEKFSAQSCTQCHTTEEWSKRKEFEHAATAYPLEGAHQKVDCKTCHTASDQLFPVKPPKYMSVFKFPKLATDKCLACHKDVHVGQLGSECLKCHNVREWKPVKFDHQTQSRYPLSVKHAEVKCLKCHKPQGSEVVVDFKKRISVVTYKPLQTQCAACHNDPHKGHFGGQCASCHSEQAWKSTKDFHKDFTLSGVHFTLQCVECHGQNRKLAGLSQECIVCHKKDDVHSGTLPECSKCHLQAFWEDSKFRHSMTTFPLKGAHRTLLCQDCHTTGVYQGLSPDCISCHLATVQGARSPINHSPLGSFTNCTQCHHNPFSW